MPPSRPPPITWLRGTEDQVVSNRSLLDLATLGELGVMPGWPGAHAAKGGSPQEVVPEGVAHGIPLEVPGSVAEEIVAVPVR